MDARQGNGGNRERVAQSFTLTDDKGRVKTRTLPSGEVIEYAYNGEDKKKVGILSGIYLKGLWDKPIVTGMNQDRDTSLVQQFSFGNGITNTLQRDKNGRIVLAGNPKVGQTMLNYDPKQKQLEPESVKQTYSAQMGDTIHPQSGMSKQVRQVLDQVVYNRNPEPLFVQQVDVVEQISQTPEIDQWGRTVRQGDQHYQYDSQNRLIKITSTDETGQLIPIADYRYNTFNQRVAKTTYNHQGNQTKTTYYFYDGNQLIAETTDTAGQQADNLKQYVWLNDTPIAILQQGELYYIHTDHRNAPIAVTDNTSKLIWQADNEDFGYATINANSTFELNLRLSNQYYDSESGLHYNTNRYYDALNHQYLTPDPLGLAAGPDLFAFALNQPHSISDPDGLAPEFSSYSFANKLEIVLRATATLLPSSMAQVGKDLLSIVTNKTVLAATATVLATWGALHLIGVGEVFDVALAVIIAAAIPIAQVAIAFSIGWSFGKMLYGTYTATCSADLALVSSDLANSLSSAFVGLGVAKGIQVVSPILKQIPNIAKNIKSSISTVDMDYYLLKAKSALAKNKGGLPLSELRKLVKKPDVSRVRYGNQSAYKNADGSPKYPPNEGAVIGTTRTIALKENILIDRFGYPEGEYTSPYGTSYVSRAIPPDSLQKPYYVYRVLKPFNVEASKIAPWFNMPGGGVQYKFAEKVEWYVKNKYLEEVIIIE